MNVVKHDCPYRAALVCIIEAEDRKDAANASGQNASPISYWIPTKEAIQAARDLLNQDSVVGGDTD